MKRPFFLFLLLFLSLLACGEATTAQQQTASSTTIVGASIKPTPTHTLKWKTTHTFSGNGNKKTSVFDVPGDWKLIWHCENTGQNYGVDGVLYISVYSSDNSPVDPIAVSGTCKANRVTTDVTEEHQAGSVYLDVNTGLSWKIEVQELK